MHIEGGNKPTPKSPLTNPPIPRKFKTTHPPTAHTKTMIAENYLWDFVCFYIPLHGKNLKNGPLFTTPMVEKWLPGIQRLSKGRE